MTDISHSLKIVDILGKPKHDIVRLPSTMTLAQVAGWSLLYQANLDPLLDGFIAEAMVSFSLPLAVGDIKDAANAGSRVRRGAEFLFNVPTSVNNYGVYIPSFLPSLLDAGIDPLTTPVSTWVDGLVGGIDFGGTTWIAHDGSGEPLTALLKYAETFRK